MRRATSYRFSLYILVNVAFALLVGVAYGVGGFPNPRVLYLISLFALCSTSVIDLDGLNGRYMLLALFMFVYFVSFGAIDFTNLFAAHDLAVSQSVLPASSALEKVEVVILVGGIMLVIGYRSALWIAGAKRFGGVPRDWSRTTIVIVGLIFWAVGTIATYRWNVYIVPDTTNEAYRRGLSSLSPTTVTVYLLGGMCQPLGVLLLAYAWSVFRSAYLMAIVIAIVILQIFIGFVVDIKGLAMIGIILVVMTSVLVDGRLPKAWLAAGVMFVVLVYPYFNAYRAAVHGAGIARTAVVENFAEVLQKTIAAKDKVNSGRERAQTFLERSNVKGSVEVIVEKAGNGVAFQHGYTLSPILQTFIPKIIWSDKMRIPTGQLFNKQFHLFDSDDVYISPSHLGELYWNFGWAGVVLGMAFIGSICGWVGASFNVAEYRTVTRVLVTIITIKQLIVIFESAIADSYVVWIRSLAGIGLLHIAFAKVPVVSRFFKPTPSATEPLPPKPQSESLFPNLLT